MIIKKKLLLSNFFMVLFPPIAILLVGIVILFVVYGTESEEIRSKCTIEAKCISEAEADGLIFGSDYEKLSGNATVYRNSDGEYVIAFEDGRSIPSVHEHGNNLHRRVTIYIIIGLTVVMFFVNRYIAKRIYRSIVLPLDILTVGVNEICNGKLGYRIDYDKNDEFATVCNAFNEMTERLSTMTLQQQKEEQSRRQLIAGISHDLRTPLTSIKAYVVGFEEGVCKTPAMQKKYLATIKQKAGELEYIINQLFLFSKLDVGDFPFSIEKVNIGVELNQLVEDLKEEYAEKGVSLVVKELPSHVYCYIDVIQFGNVIQNVWSNTAKYKNKEQSISVISCEETGENIKISIYDDGPGVKEEALDKLFDVFYRTDDSRQNVALGSGLGLAISAKIINSFKGKISARNYPDAGLCIDIVLPKGEEYEKNTDN